jgi:recombination protein RecA
MAWSADAEAARQAVRQKFSDLYGVMGDLADPRGSVVGRSTSTGVVSLDAALEGPLPSGAIEVYGEASSGKTTLLYEIIATAQKSGMLTALCVSEYLDIPYMRRLGVDLNSLILITGNGGEDVLAGALDFLNVHSDCATVLAVDSATSLRPKDDAPGNWMRMLDSFLVTGVEGLNHESCIVVVNQVRMKRSVDPHKFFVEGAVTSTAKKIIDLFSLRMELSRGESRDGEHEMEVNIISSSLSRPATVLRLPMVQGKGIDTMKDLLQFGLSRGVVTQAGAWYTVDEKYKLGCGMQEAVRQLEENHEVAAYLLDRVMVRA